MNEKYKIIVGTSEQVEAKLNKLDNEFDIEICGITQINKTITTILKLALKTENNRRIL